MRLTAGRRVRLCLHRNPPNAVTISPVSQPESFEARNTATGNIVGLAETPEWRLRNQLLLVNFNQVNPLLFSRFELSCASRTL